MKSMYVPNAILAEKTAQGVCEKWFDKNTNRWNKADMLGYEALAEVLISALLEKTNIESDTPFTFVRYKMEKFNLRGSNRIGCSCENFLGEKQMLVSIDKLFKKYFGRSIEKEIKKFSSRKKQLSYIVEKTKQITGLDQFDKYLTLLIEIDSLFLNSERTFKDIYVIYDLNENIFLYSPVFNNGAALMSDMLNNPSYTDVQTYISNTRAMPMNTSFNRQLKAIHSLFGNVLKVPYISSIELSTLIAPVLEYYPASMRAIIAERVQNVHNNAIH